MFTNLFQFCDAGEQDMDAYENEEFDEEDAEEVKTASQMKKEQVELNAASNAQDNQPLNFGNVYNDPQ